MTCRRRPPATRTSLARRGLLAFCALVLGAGHASATAASAAPATARPPALATHSAPEAFAEAIAARVQVLRQRLAELTPQLPAGLSSYGTQMAEQLAAAETATATGLTLAAMGIVRETSPLMVAFAFQLEHGDSVTTPQQYVALSDSMAQGLRDRAAAILARDWSGASALVRAMAESAAARVPTLIHGGSGFGADVGDASSGLFYLGMAEGSAELGEWLATLPSPAAGAMPDWKGLESQVAGLDRRVLSAYTDPAAQVDQHPAFIRASAALKVAEGMLRDGLRAGALLAFLEGERAYADLEPADATRPSLADLEALDRELTERLARPGQDHSVGALYEQLARQRLAAARTAGPDVDPTSLAGAEILLRRVVPGYLDVVDGAASATTAAPDPEVTVTLVRWPFT